MRYHVRLNQSVIAWVLGSFLSLAAPLAGAITLDEIISLEYAGVSEDTILDVVESEGSVFALSVDDILDLRAAGASDAFIRALMATSDYARPDADRDDYVVYDYDSPDPYDYDEYTVIFANYYYDPFAYHWYVWPHFYVYYSPFWWQRAGFYYAGYWAWDWWDPWSSCVRYCDWHYGYHRHCGESRTRALAGRTWHHDPEGPSGRYARERRIYHRAGLTEDPPAPQVRSRDTYARGSSVRATDRASEVRSLSGRTSAERYVRGERDAVRRETRSSRQATRSAERSRAADARKPDARQSRIGEARGRERPSSEPARRESRSYRAPGRSGSSDRSGTWRRSGRSDGADPSDRSNRDSSPAPSRSRSPDRLARGADSSHESESSSSSRAHRR